jgi:hypothetical protein
LPAHTSILDRWFSLLCINLFHLYSRCLNKYFYC